MLEVEKCETCMNPAVWKKNGHFMCQLCDDLEEENMEEPYAHCFPNFDQITEKIFLGNADTAMCKDVLKDAGITHILNCGREQPCRFKDDFKYLKIPIDDDEKEHFLKYLEDTYQFIESSNKVYIHCMAGVSRSPSITIAYLMKKNKWTLQESFDFLKSKRRCVRPNEGFQMQLKEYEKSLIL
jgi:hypothetical protein